MTKLKSRRWLVRHLLVLMALIVLVNLGLWQLRRLEERRAQNNGIMARLSEPAIVLTGDEVDPDQLHYRRVLVTGTFDNEAGIVLRNRALNGRPGVHLVAPLRMEGSNRAVLVDRGWIPLERSDVDERRIYNVSGKVTIEGIAYRTQSPPAGFLVPTDPTLEPGQTGLDAWFRVDIDRIQQQMPYPLLPVFIEQSPNAETGEDSLPLQAADPVLDEGPHLGYALQWFSFALILLVVYGVFVRRELSLS